MIYNEELLKRAQIYTEKLAQGINPLDDSTVENDSIINNVKISRCLFFINDYLKDQLKFLIKPTQNKNSFEYNEERMKQVPLSQSPISLTVLLTKINKQFPEQRKLNYNVVSQMLKDKGILIDNLQGNPRLISSNDAINFGIKTIKFQTQSGEKLKTVYNEIGQRFVLENLKDINKYF